jgi:SbsC C-terminal domain
MSKKAFKIASAAAVAASAFVAVNPAQAATAAEAEVLVKKAENLGGTLKWAISLEGSWDGFNYPNMKLFNDTKDAHAKALAAVSTLSGTQKAALETRLNNNVKLYVDRAVTLIDAVSAGMKIDAKKEALASKLDASEIDADTVTAYHELAKEIRKQEVLLSRVYGQSSRAEIRENYQHTAEAVLEDALYPVSVNIELGRLHAAVQANDVEEATLRFDNINSWLPLVTDETMKAELTAAFEIEKEAYEAILVPSVESVSAINANSVSVEGTGLLNLSVDNFSLEGNTISSYEVNEEGTQATITFGDKVASGEEQTLLVTNEVEGEEVTTEWTFTYTLEIGTLAVSDVVADDDTEGQALTFTIDGEEADLEYLEESGYTVEFQATDEIFTELDTDGEATQVASLTSPTGELLDSLTVTPTTGYGYKVVIKNADDEVVAESGLASVVVEDLNSKFVSIDSYEVSAGSLLLENSKTALVGEDVVIGNVEGTTEAGDDEQAISAFSVKSSNPAVAYVGAAGTIKTVKAGTTTITITAGDTTTSFKLTVSADAARVASKATATPTSTKLVAGEATIQKDFDLVVTDQFGEAFTGDVFVELPTIKVDNVDTNLVDFAGAGTSTVAIADGEGSFTVTGTTAGKGNVVVLDEVDGTTLATVVVDVTEDTDVATRKFEIADGESDDLVVDFYATGSGDDMVSDASVNLAFNKYNAAGYYVGQEALAIAPQAASTYTVQVNTETDADVQVVGSEVVVTAGEEAGSVEVVISYGATVVAKKTVTVKNSTPTIAGLNFKTVAPVTEADVDINAATVLTFDEETGLVSGLDVSTDEEVYFDAATLTFYVEKDGTDGLDNELITDTDTDLVIGTLGWVSDSGITVTPDTDYTTQDGDSGNVIFTVSDVDGKFVDSTAVSVEVPEAE